MPYLDFDATQHESMDELAALPEGRYVAAIVESVVRSTRSGTGKYLQLGLRVLDGDQAGRVLFTHLNLVNPHPTTEKLARGELSSICRAVGVTKIEDTSELHDIPMLVDVRCRRRDDNGEMTNQIRSYLPVKPLLRAEAAVETPEENDRPRPRSDA